MRRIASLALAASALPLLGAAEAGFAPGLWEMRNTPGVATLDGRELHELPIGPITSETICLSPTDAAEPARLLVRDLGPECAIASQALAGGAVRIAGTCPNQDEGPDATFELKGRYAPAAYEVDFATTQAGENGRMTFSGKMVGRRLGPCTEGAPATR